MDTDSPHQIFQLLLKDLTRLKASGHDCNLSTPCLMKHLKHGMPSGREQAVSGTPHQAEEHALNLIGLIWRGSGSPQNPTEICPAVSFHEKIHGLMDHSDPPKVFFVKQICANPINDNMLSSVHILQHFSLHICYPKRPISRPKHDLIPKTHAHVFFGTCPKTKMLRRHASSRLNKIVPACIFWYLSKNKMAASSRSSNTIVSKGLIFPLHHCRAHLHASTIKLLSEECMTLRKMSQIISNHFKTVPTSLQIPHVYACLVR